MSDFVNTIDLLGDEAVTIGLIERTFSGDFNDNEIDFIGRYAFNGCSNLTSVNMPNATSADVNAFSGCASLTCADFMHLENIGTNAFANCKKLSTLIIRGSTLCTLSGTGSLASSTPFHSTGAGGTLLVPSALVEPYKTATNWSVIWGFGHNRFLALEDYTVDGTTTGAIDWDKLGGIT